MAQQLIREKEDETTPEEKHPQKAEHLLQKNAAGNADTSSLVDALQALVLEMSRIESDSEAVRGLKKLGMIRESFLGPGATAGDVAAARRDAEALIAWVEAKLEQLRQQLARKRRAQEGQVMEQLAKQREAEGPQLIPTELIDAVVHATNDRDPMAVTSTAPVAQPEAPEFPEAPEDEAEPEALPEVDASGELKSPEADAPKEEPVKPKPPKAKRLSPEPGPIKGPEWSKYERLAAHMTAFLKEDPGFFEKLRVAAKRKGERQAPPSDSRKAGSYQQAVRDLTMRLANMELQIRAAAKLDSPELRTPMIQGAARELKLFMRELKHHQQAMPEMAGEYERLFGGWAHQFAAMDPVKGRNLLVKPAQKKQTGREVGSAEPGQERQNAQRPRQDAPQLVLRRKEDWEN
ncbi:MAG: hypothetical protein IKI02_08305 [Oscillospiraceae bacterium]|nr:hypothetical protein [Oscillospiraceae bacterium]